MSQLGSLSAPCACAEVTRVSHGLLDGLLCPLLRASGGSSLITPCLLNGAQTRALFVVPIADLEPASNLPVLHLGQNKEYPLR